MPKFIITPTPVPPFCLTRISLPYGSLTHKFDTEDEMISWVIQRNKEVGVIPCESETERQEMSDLWDSRHPGGAHEGLPALVLPPIGQHWIVDETELPPDDYFFNAWEWSD